MKANSLFKAWTIAVGKEDAKPAEVKEEFQSFCESALQRNWTDVTEWDDNDFTVVREFLQECYGDDVK